MGTLVACLWGSFSSFFEGGYLALTIAWNVELNEIFKVLYIRRQAANFIVTQSQLSQAMQSEEILQARRREKKNKI